MNSLNWNPCNEYSPKQIALFQSVTSMLEEGISSSCMKVSDIAARAGIGKGTTYEYFSSKEELIARAVFYDIQIRIMGLTERVNSVSGFKNMFFEILDWLEENFQAKHVLSRILGMEHMEQQFSSDVGDRLEEYSDDMVYIKDGLSGLIRVAEKEELISAEIPHSLQALSFVNQMFAYVAFLKMQESITDVSKKQVKEFLYNSLIRSLQA